MAEPAKSTRRSLYIQQALEVLAQAGRPVPRPEVMARVEPRLTFNAYELEIVSEKSPQPRWQNQLAWASTDMKAAGWIKKSSAGWEITDAGRAALKRYSPNPEGAAQEASRAYQAQHRSNRDAPRYDAVLDAALEHLEPGEWTTYSDLAPLAETNQQTVGWYMRETKVDGAHRVLQKSGTPAPGFEWVDESRTDTQREALEAEGVVFNSDGTASERQHVRTEDLREFLEDAGIITKHACRAWFVRSSGVNGKEHVHDWVAGSFASLHVDGLREVAPELSRQELKEIVEEDFTQSSYNTKRQRVDELHAFLSRMNPGDVIVTSSGQHVWLGVIEGPAEYLQGPSGATLRRAVSWDESNVPYDEVGPKTLSRFNVGPDVVEMTQQLKGLDKLRTRQASEAEDTESGPVAAPLATVAEDDEVSLPDASEELTASLNVDRAWLQECIELLRDRPQLIFYGPPGTGKTYIAQALAQHLAGDNVRLVQFHPAYSYEDFFEGYRPTPEGGFALRPGPFRKTVDQARENPGVPYFLIIDEINRGNLAKIFGELYFLLEYRDQNVDLLYATEDDIGFTLPANVFIIATMNTADRSIALVDAAMRRRFAFLQLHPTEYPVDSVLRRWLDAKGLPTVNADLLDELNSRIDDPDFRIGPSYLMRRAVYENGGLERAWRTTILPLLEEHHYGESLDIEARYGLAAIRRQAKPAPQSTNHFSDGSAPTA